MATVLTVGTADSSGIDIALAKAPTYGGSVAGRVTESGSAPVPGISVTACPTAGPPACFATTTGADGTYTIGLPAGSYTVSFDDPTTTHPSGSGVPCAGRDGVPLRSGRGSRCVGWGGPRLPRGVTDAP